ncbi:unnamed protein product [Gordionus sp. m RMFG-2023]
MVLKNVKYKNDGLTILEESQCSSVFNFTVNSNDLISIKESPLNNSHKSLSLSDLNQTDDLIFNREISHIKKEKDTIFKRLIFESTPFKECDSIGKLKVNQSCSSNDELESFFQKLNLKNIKSQPKQFDDIKLFILSSESEDSSNEVEIYEEILKFNTDNLLIPDIISTPIVKTKGKFPPFKFQTTRKPKLVSPLFQKPIIFSQDDDILLDTRAQNEKFLESLVIHGSEKKNLLNKYVTSFQRFKHELTQRLYEIYNSHIFKNQLPQDFDIKWNPRLTKTAGKCFYKRIKYSPQISTDNIGRSKKIAWIELSDKVCDSAERVRDVLIHEVCHSAVWLLKDGYGCAEKGHGPLWKYYARKSREIFPCLRPIERCHSYNISTKYVYRCTVCLVEIGRHSKSIDVKTQSCSSCGGSLNLLVWRKKSKVYEICIDS